MTVLHAACSAIFFIIKDHDIIQVLQYALELTEMHLQKVEDFLTKDGYPIPIGFTDEDVTVEAPPLFTDTYIIVYLHIMSMSIHGLTRYSGAIGNFIREDQRKYFIGVISESLELHDRATKVLTDKGIISKPSSLLIIRMLSFLKNKALLKVFGKTKTY